MEGLPLNSGELIKLLDQLYPTITPKPKDSLEHIMYKAGQRNVVDTLLDWLNKEDL